MINAEKRQDSRQSNFDASLSGLLAKCRSLVIIWWYEAY